MRPGWRWFSPGCGISGTKSAVRLIPDYPEPLSPNAKAKPYPGPRAGAIAGDVVDPFHPQRSKRASGADPVANLGTTGLKFLLRQGRQRSMVLHRQCPNHLAVKILVNNEVTEAA